MALFADPLSFATHQVREPGEAANVQPPAFRQDARTAHMKRSMQRNHVFTDQAILVEPERIGRRKESAG